MCVGSASPVPFCLQTHDIAQLRNKLKTGQTDGHRRCICCQPDSPDIHGQFVADLQLPPHQWSHQSDYRTRFQDVTHLSIVGGKVGEAEGEVGNANYRPSRAGAPDR